MTNDVDVERATTWEECARRTALKEKRLAAATRTLGATRDETEGVGT